MIPRTRLAIWGRDCWVQGPPKSLEMAAFNSCVRMYRSVPAPALTDVPMTWVWRIRQSSSSFYYLDIGIAIVSFTITIG